MTEPDDDVPDEVRSVALALSEKVLSWAESPETTFASEPEQKKALYDSIHLKDRAWQLPKPCMYRGCTNLSIKRSHTIQRSGSLGVIAEAGHVLRPKAYPDKGVILERIGVSEASTFAGFCAIHEGLFSSFETTGVITSTPDVQLQVFRSICREIVRKRFDIEVLTAAKTQMIARVRLLAEAEAKRLGTDLKDVTIDGGIVGKADKFLQSASSVLNDMENIYDDVFAELNGQTRAGTEIRAYKINVVVPVALSGFGMLNARGVNLPCVMGVVPEPTESLVYLATKGGHSSLIDDYFEHISSRLVLLDRIETWMTRGTDHWFIQPSVWDAIPKARQNKVIDGLADVSAGIEAELPVSIFDDIRRAAISDQEAAGVPPEVAAYIESQRAKLL